MNFRRLPGGRSGRKPSRAPATAPAAELQSHPSRASTSDAAVLTKTPGSVSAKMPSLASARKTRYRASASTPLTRQLNAAPRARRKRLHHTQIHDQAQRPRHQRTPQRIPDHPSVHARAAWTRAVQLRTVGQDGWANLVEEESRPSAINDKLARAIRQCCDSSR